MNTLNEYRMIPTRRGRIDYLLSGEITAAWDDEIGGYRARSGEINLPITSVSPDRAVERAIEWLKSTRNRSDPWLLG